MDGPIALAGAGATRPAGRLPTPRRISGPASSPSFANSFWAFSRTSRASSFRSRIRRSTRGSVAVIRPLRNGALALGAAARATTALYACARVGVAQRFPQRRQLFRFEFGSRPARPGDPFLHLPDEDRAVHVARGQLLAVRREGQARDVVRLARQPGQLSAVGRVEQHDRPGGRPGGDGQAVGREDGACQASLRRTGSDRRVRWAAPSAPGRARWRPHKESIPRNRRAGGIGRPAKSSVPPCPGIGRGRGVADRTQFLGGGDVPEEQRSRCRRLRPAICRPERRRPHRKASARSAEDQFPCPFPHSISGRIDPNRRRAASCRRRTA